MIDENEIKHIAKLAHLELSEEELKGIEKDLSDILHYINVLEEVDISGVEPCFYVATQKNVMRKDKAEQCPKEVVKTLLDEAPQKEGRHIKVPPVF